MKVRCVSNTGASLRPFEYNLINNQEEFGRFGASGFSEYDVEIGKEYLVMGLIIFQTFQAYLIDERGNIGFYPCQLFSIVDNEINSDWYFRAIEMDEDIYPFIQAILGYYELCSDKKSYENLIVEKEEDACRTYFRRKIELENKLAE